METRISLGIVVADDTILGMATVYVGRWEGSKLIACAKPYKKEVIIAPLDMGTSVYPYAIATIRDAADRVIASMLEAMSAGEVLLMHQTPELE